MTITHEKAAYSVSDEIIYYVSDAKEIKSNAEEDKSDAQEI